MKTYSIEEFKNTDEYQEFINDNPSFGSLKIRAYAAREAIPVSGLKIVIQKEIGDNNVIFFEGVTDSSGVIEKIKLPAPKLDSNNLNAPLYTTYQVLATYAPDNASGIYNVNMYEDICVVQNISIVPEMGIRRLFPWQ